LEPISSHAEHARKCLKVEYLGRKILCYRPLGPYGFGFCKKVKKKFHACVPLKCRTNFIINNHEQIQSNICTGHLREDCAVRAGAPQQGVRQEHEVRVQLLQALGIRRFYRQ
jgi:hypothetical protein